MTVMGAANDIIAVDDTIGTQDSKDAVDTRVGAAEGNGVGGGTVHAAPPPPGAQPAAAQRPGARRHRWL